MPNIHYQGHVLERAVQESVLDTLLKHDSTLSHSCKNGVCQSCLMKVKSGAIPAKSQQGLKRAWIDQDYFLPCHAFPENDLTVEKIDAAATLIPAHIIDLKRVNQLVMKVHIKPESEFEFKAGQYCTWIRDDGLARSYSIANLPQEDVLEFHLRIYPQGQMSQWLLQQQAFPVAIQIRGPAGECYYQPEMKSAPLLLIGTGTGLAPLWGVVQDALKQNHQGAIHFIHASSNAEGLYASHELNKLANDHAQLTIETLNFTELNPKPDQRFSLAKHVLANYPQLKQAEIFLCGNPKIVNELKKHFYLSGADLKRMHADPFLSSV